MSQRLDKISQHLGAASAVDAPLAANPTSARAKQAFGTVGVKSPDDVVIVSAKRTAICKARRGGFKDTTPDDMLIPVLQAVMEESKVDPKSLGDFCLGNVQTIGSYVLGGRVAQMRAGLSHEVPFRVTNRQCASGLEAVTQIAQAIKCGSIDAGIGGGVESMTNGGAPGDPSSLPPMNMSEAFQHPIAKEQFNAMGVTSENVAEKYGVSREVQDRLAVESHMKALRAQKEGRFDREIVPVKVTVEDADGNEKEMVITKDEGPREGSTLEKLAKLKPVFKKGGSTTAGNASQVSDGASAVVLMRRSEAERQGVKVRAVFRGSKVVGVPAEIMGIGPAVAVPALLSELGVDKNDVDVYEINEAFASQAAMSVETIGIPMSKVNPNGGAIALGHPLGNTGARMIVTGLAELERTGGKLCVASMCIGGGQGASCLFERE